MTSQPTLETTRLVLRPFRAEDAPTVQRLAGDRAVSDTTLNIPHPYDDGMAEEWIATHWPGFRSGTLATFAVVVREGDRLAGAIGLQVDGVRGEAELGYWVGRPFWNQGYATEAAIAVLEFGFVDLGLEMISARHLAGNPASGRVMEKAGMRCNGTIRGKTRSGSIKDLVSYALLRDDWSKAAVK